MTALSDAVAALQNFQLNTLQSTESIVDSQGRPSLKFQAAYQRTIRAIEAAIETLALSDTNQDDLLTQIQEALNIALAAQADLSVTTAFIRTRDSAVTGMTIDATTTTITVSAHDRSYLDPTETVSVTGDTVSSLAPSTTYYIHYTDLDYSGGTVGYQVSTSLEGAVPSPTEPFRHYVGTVATPAAGTSTGTPAPDPTWKQVTASGGSGDMLAANNLSDVANAATARDNLGVEIGADVLGMGGGTLTGDLSVPDEAYGSGWNASVEVPTKNAVYDKIEALPSPAMVLISEQTPSGTGTVTFSSIPATYRDLRLVVRGRGAAVAASVTVAITVNNDTGANYDYERLTGTGTSASANNSFTNTNLTNAVLPAASAAAGIASSFEYIFHDYRGTSFQKSGHAIINSKVGTAAGNLTAHVIAFFWRSTAAINRVDVTLSSGNFENGSVVSLYGVM